MKAQTFAEFSVGMDVLHSRLLEEWHPDGLPGMPGLIVLEQRMRRSYRQRECIDCGAPATVWQKSVLVACVPEYGHCADCAAWWKAKR